MLVWVGRSLGILGGTALLLVLVKLEVESRRNGERIGKNYEELAIDV